MAAFPWETGVAVRPSSQGRAPRSALRVQAAMVVVVALVSKAVAVVLEVPAEEKEEELKEPPPRMKEVSLSASHLKPCREKQKKQQQQQGSVPGESAQWLEQAEAPGPVPAIRERLCLQAPQLLQCGRERRRTREETGVRRPKVQALLHRGQNHGILTSDT